MSSMTLGFNDGVRGTLASRSQMKAVKSDRNIDSNGSKYLSDLIASQMYNPMNLATIICLQFQNHSDALVSAFLDDLGMFEYLYEYLPKNITVRVLNQIPLEDAIGIVERHQTQTFVYDQVDPILYVVRYFSNSKVGDPTSIDPHCIEFNKNVVPKGSVLDFALKCKKYISGDDFQNLVKMLC